MPAIAIDPYLLREVLRAEEAYVSTQKAEDAAAEIRGWAKLLQHSRETADHLGGMPQNFVLQAKALEKPILSRDILLLQNTLADPAMHAAFGAFVGAVQAYLPLAEASASQHPETTHGQRKSAGAKDAFERLQQSYQGMDGALRTGLYEASPYFTTLHLYLLETMLQRQACGLAEKALASGVDGQALLAAFLQPSDTSPRKT